MNERINQLANIWANRRSEDEKLGITYTFSEKALETFTELIIRECCQFENSYSGDARLVSRHYGRRIREHFGVEE